MLLEVPGDWTLFAEFYFPFGPQANQRINRKTGKKTETMRNYLSDIARMATDQVQAGECKKAPSVKLLVIFHFHVHNSLGDQTNNAKSIEDALNRIAYHDDRQNRQVAILETIIEKDRTPHTTVEIYVPKEN